MQSVVKGRCSAALTIRARRVTESAEIGESIAVNGVCLTVTRLLDGAFAADVMHETLNRSTLLRLGAGDAVNLERAMRADGRFGGHIVAGHVDGVGTIRDVRRDDTALWYTIAAEDAVLRYVVEKGSVAVDGVSLTVAAVGRTDFSVSVIPHTAAQTTLHARRAGDKVNLEADLIGKYVEKLFAPAAREGAQSAVTREFLTRCGF